MGMTRVDFELIAWSVNRSSDDAVAQNLNAKQTRDLIVASLAEDIRARHPRFEAIKFCRKAGHRKELRAIEHAAIVAQLGENPPEPDYVLTITSKLVDQELPL